MEHRNSILYLNGSNVLGDDFYTGIRGVQTFAQKGEFSTSFIIIIIIVTMLLCNIIMLLVLYYVMLCYVMLL